MTTVEIRNLVEKAAGHWPECGGDTNLFDVYWLAQRLREDVGLTVPTQSLSKDRGVEAFECVESHVLRDLPGRGLLREAPLSDVAARILSLQEALRSILPFSDDENVMVAFYIWQGCVHMANLLRKSYVVAGGEDPYTPELRRAGYDHIRECWESESQHGNPWVRYGVSLARLMEQGRKKEKFKDQIVEDWVPNDSPYREP
jgi:hypothetical protein